MMSRITRCLVVVIAVCLHAAAGVAMAQAQVQGQGQAQAAAPTMQAELIRSTTGRGIDSSGFASLSVPLKKGAVYDVLKQGNGNVLLSVNGQQVMVQGGSVTITAKPQAPVVTVQGFVPGKVVLISAKYTIENDQPRNVKNNLQKLIPQTLLTAPLEITVTDALSTAAQDQGNSTQTAAIVTGNGGAAIVMQNRTSAKNILIVQYLYNGQKFTKQVPEGEVLVLP